MKKLKIGYDTVLSEISAVIKKQNELQSSEKMEKESRRF